MKYKKSSRALCTLYPDEGQFTALITVGAKEAPEAELLLPWSAQQLRKELYANCEVLEERAEDEGAVFRLRGEPDTIERLRAQFALTR